MTTSFSSFFADQARSDRLGLVLALFALLLAPVGLLADKAVVPLSLVTVLAGGLALGRSALPWRVIDRPLAATLGLFFAWCLVATIWRDPPFTAANLAVRIAFLIFALLYLAALAGRLDAPWRERVARCLAAGSALAAALTVVELASGGLLLDLLQGPAGSSYAADSRLNRGVSALAILAWPLAAFAWHRRFVAAALLLPPGCFALTLFSESSASVVALALALPAAALALLGRGAARTVLVLAIVGAVLGAPLIVEALQRSHTSLVEILPDTALYRLHVWGVVNERIAERPVAGWGFDASAKLPTGDAQPFRPGGKVIPSHPHNGSLQIMVELGIIGSLLAAIALFVIARRIDRLDRIPRACAIGMTVTILGVACTAYGIWQSHWLAVIGAAAAMFIALQPAPVESS